MHVFSCEFCEIFKNTLQHICWLLLTIVEGSQNRKPPAYPDQI